MNRSLTSAMNRSLTSALLAITLTLGCGGAALAAPYATLAPIFAADARKDYATELKLLRPLVDKGDVDAQFLLALMYSNGTGVPQDYKEAVRLYRLAAAQGHAMAQSNLASMYSLGEGVIQDYKEAVRLYKLSAAQGEDRSKNLLGFSYLLGEGVAQDYVRAHMWFNLAASSLSGEDQKNASTQRDNVAAKMTPAQIAEAQAMARKCQASNFKQCD